MSPMAVDTNLLIVHGAMLIVRGLEEVVIAQLIS